MALRYVIIIRPKKRKWPIQIHFRSAPLCRSLPPCRLAEPKPPVFPCSPIWSCHCRCGPLRDLNSSHAPQSVWMVDVLLFFLFLFLLLLSISKWQVGEWWWPPFTTCKKCHRNGRWTIPKEETASCKCNFYVMYAGGFTRRRRRLSFASILGKQ